MTEASPNRFRGIVPSHPVDVQPLTPAQRLARRLYREQTGGPVPDDFAREQRARVSKPPRETKRQRREREEMEAQGFRETRPGSGIWYSPGASKPSSESA